MNQSAEALRRNPLYEGILREIDRLRSFNEGDPSERYAAYCNRIKRPDLLTRLTPRCPLSYSSSEYLLPGLEGDGGLGALARDDFLVAVALGIPGDYYGLYYREKKVQKLRTDGKNHFWQDIVTEPNPSLEELGYTRVTNVKVVLNGELGPGCEIPVFLSPLSTEITHQFVMEVPGPVYPGVPNSNKRLWNNIVLGFGGYQIEKQRKEQGFIDDTSFYHTNESAMIWRVVAAIDDLTVERGDTEEAYKEVEEIIKGKNLLANHTLVLAAEASFSFEQCQKFVFNNLRSKTVADKLKKFIEERGNRLVALELAFEHSGKCHAVSIDHARRSSEAFNREVAPVTNGIYEGWAMPMVATLQNYGVIDEFGYTTPDYRKRIDQIPTVILSTYKNEGQDAFRQFLLDGKRRDQFDNIVTLPENSIIIGDARRFAGYKRRKTLFTYFNGLKYILERHQNVHIFISGKAHPDDELPREELAFVLNTIASNYLFRKQIHFLPNWEVDFAQTLFPAAHIWLNYPRLGWEACGTSGMKAGLNAALLLSTVDGFLAEIKKNSFYRISGPSDSPEEAASFYINLTHAVYDAQYPETWAYNVKRLWKGNFLNVVNGNRMMEDKLNLIMPKSVLTHG